MPRKPKPPGMEKWTWDEIHAGRRMTKHEKRWRKVARNMAATDQDGSLKPPSVESNPGYHLYFGAILVMLIVVAIFFPKGCVH